MSHTSGTGKEGQSHRPRADRLSRQQDDAVRGCGHNAITERIIDAFFEMGVDPT